MSMMLMVSAVDLLVIFLAVECAAISAYFLGATPAHRTELHQRR
jgi:NADH:ubiquinone oxidoreductase subunit 2 (subunit N)